MGDPPNREDSPETQAITVKIDRIPEERKAAGRAKAVIRRKENSAKVNFRQLVNRRRRPDEIPSRKVAVENFCRECMGWESGYPGVRVKEGVRRCTATECWLYPWRVGPLEEE